MESGKRLRSISEEKRTSDRGKKANASLERRIKDDKDHRSRGKNKPSLIPVPKGEKIEPKSLHQKQRKCYSSSKLCCVSSKAEKRCEDFDAKLKILEEKEKSIAQYYLKVEDLIRKLTETEQAENGKPLKRKGSRTSEARKMTSEPLVFCKKKTSTDVLADLENSVQQISKIWLQASSDLSSTLKHLKSNPSLDPMEFELEKVRIQLAIKQTKSLTLVKTRDILAEAKKLFRHREMIRTELESIINYEKLNGLNNECLKEENQLEEKDTSTSLESDKKQNVGGTGDTPKDEKEVEADVVTTTSAESSEKERGGTSAMEEENSVQDTSCKPEDTSSSSEGREVKSESNEQPRKDKPDVSLPMKAPSTEVWAREMSKKNETIACLYKKIFELQKTCNEQSHKCGQLQIKLFQFSEKIQWNQVLWEQIGKLKDQIKGLQQSNKHLESQKRELECKVTKLDSELERLIKMNHFLNQRKYLLSAQESLEKDCHCMDHRRGEDANKAKSDKCDSEKTAEDKILAEKQNAINQLRTILSVMKDQENFAQKQITVFQNKIEELERNTKS